MAKINDKYISNAECVVPSVLTQSKVFLVIPENDSVARKEIVPRVLGSRKSTEYYTYSGYKLDLIKDYPLFHILLREKQNQGSNKVTVNLNAVMKELGVQVNPKNRKKIYDRIWDLSKCSISVTDITDSGGKYDLDKRTVLIHTLEPIDKKHVAVSFCDSMDLIIRYFDNQVIDLDEYRRLTKQSAMAIYLAIKSHAFIRKNTLNLTLKVLRVHYDDARSDKQVKVELNAGFEQLIENGLIKSFEEGLTKTNKETTYKIVK